MKLLNLGIIVLFVTTIVVWGNPIELNEEVDDFYNGIDMDNVIDDDVNDDDDETAEELSGDVLNFLDEDGITWRSINLTETLEDDDFYDYSSPELMLLDSDGLGTLSIQDEVTPLLYTKDNPDVPFELTTVNGRDSPINISHPTNIVVHGWLETATKMWVQRMKDKFFINNDHNVITLDWAKWAQFEYIISARKTRKIGAYLGQVLVSLIKSEKIRPEDIHLVGHSLGAHLAGIAAKTVKQQTGHLVGRITGLDPARPLFEFPLKVTSKKRLDKNDALFVDVIHTCGGSLGVKAQFGKVDFYPNKGKAIQPGCGILKNHICSHARGYRFFTESINSKNFIAVKCSSWRKFKRGKCSKNEEVSMGYFLNSSIPEGKYYLRTKRRSPFAKGSGKTIYLP